MAETLTQHIIVGTDFSQASELAVGAARILALQNDAKCTLVHVFDPSSLAARGHGYELHSESMTMEPDVEQRIYDELRRVANEKLGDVRDVETVLITGHNAALSLCDYAKSQEAAMIIVSTHGRTGLSHLLIGSVAEKVVRHAPCPVLTLRSGVSE